MSQTSNNKNTPQPKTQPKHSYCPQSPSIDSIASKHGATRNVNTCYRFPDRLLVSGFGIDDHLRGMAEQLGCRGHGSILLVETIPAWLALVAYAAIGWRLWRLSQRDKIEAGDDRNREITAEDRA